MGKLRLLYRAKDSLEVATKEKSFKDGVIVFLDALGVKGIWARAEPRLVIEAWDYVIEAFRSAIENAPKSIGENSRDLVYRMSAFSDTIIIALPCGDDDPSSLIALMAKTISKPFTEAVMKGIFFRGVIAIGKFYLSDNLLIGPAIDEAAEWFTQPEWIGVSTTPTATFGLSRLEEQGAIIHALVKYPVPMKNGPEQGWAVAWPNELQSGAVDNTRKPLSPKGQVLNVFAKRPISVNVTAKYTNTIKFLDAVLNKGSIDK